MQKRLVALTVWKRSNGSKTSSVASPTSGAQRRQTRRTRLSDSGSSNSPMPTALASIGATARAYVEMYRKYTDDFPRESRDAAYEDRIKRTYPIHPELFDRLYEEWS